MSQARTDLPRSPAPAPRTRLRRRLYLVGSAVDSLGSGLWMPFGLIFLTRAQGLPVGPVGLALTIGGIAGLLLGPLGGSLVDRYGGAPALLASNLIRAVTFSLYPLVGSVWQVAIIAGATAAADRMFWTANAPLLGRLASGRELDRLLGTQSVIRIVGLGVGAAVATPFAGSVTGLHTIAYLNAVTFALTALIVYPVARALDAERRPPASAGEAAPSPAEPATPSGSSGSSGEDAVQAETAAAVEAEEGSRAAPRPEGWRRVLADRPYVVLCAAQLLLALAASSFVVILPLVSLDPLGGPLWLPGGSIVVGNVVLALLQKPAVRLGERATRVRVVSLSSLVFTVAFLIMLPAPHVGVGGVVVLVLASSVVGVVAEALFAPLMTAAANSAAPEGFTGRYSALFQTAWGAANILAPAVCTGLLAAGYEVLWIGLSVLTLLTLPLLRYAARGLPAASLRS